MRVKTKTTLMRAFTFLLLIVTTLSATLALLPGQTASAQPAGFQCEQSGTWDPAANACTKPRISGPRGSTPCPNGWETEVEGGACTRNAVPAGTTCIDVTTEAQYNPATQQCEMNTINRQGQTTCGHPAFQVVNGVCRMAPTTVAVANPDNPRNEQAQENAENNAEAVAEADNCPIAQNQELRWAYCPLFNGIGLLTNTIDSFINEYLTTGNKIFDDSDTGTVNGAPVTNGYKNAWQTFRNFGIALVVIAGLVMLVSEAFGLEFIDAYTVRRVLPRLLIAILGISLSWELCEFLVTFFDTLGRAAGSIIYTAFNVGDAGIPIWPSIMAYLIGGGTVLYGALLLGGFGLLSMLGTLILAMVIGAAVLILRQAIIIAAVIMAPLAIAAYILPNTNKLASFWWDTFIKMLMLYPIATGLIALCKVMGKIAMGNPGGTGERTAMGDLIAVISGIIFFFAGYALIPVAFRLTGGLVATIGGIANDRSKGGFDRLKNYRAGKREHNAAALKAGNRFSNDNVLGRGFNRTTRNASMLSQAGFNPRRMRSRLRAARSTADFDTAAEALDKNPYVGAIKDNDSLVWASMNGKGSDADVRSWLSRDQYNSAGKQIHSAQSGTELEQNVALVRQARKSVGEQAFRTAMSVAQAGTGTGFEHSGQMLETIAKNSNGDHQLAARTAFASKSAAKASGRDDMAAYGSGAMLGQLSNAMKGQKVDTRTLDLDAFNSTDTVTKARMRNVGLQQMTGSVNSRIQELSAASQRGQITGEERVELGQLMAEMRNTKDTALTYGAPQRQQTMNEGVKMINAELKGHVDEYTPIIATDVATRQLVDQTPGEVSAYKEYRSQRAQDPNDPNAKT